MLIYEWILEKWGHISVNLYRYPRMWWWALLTYIHRTCSKVNFVFHISDHDDCTCHLTCHSLRPILYRGLCLMFITDEQWMIDGCCYQGPGAAKQTRCMKHDQNRPMYFQFHKSDQPKSKALWHLGCQDFVTKSLEWITTDSGLMTIRHSAEISDVYIYGFLDSIT